MDILGCDVLQDSEPVTALAYSPDGSRIYTASRSLQQRAWDVDPARVLRTWKVCPQQASLDSMQAVAFKDAMQCLKRQEPGIWTVDAHGVSSHMPDTQWHCKALQTHSLLPLQTTATMHRVSAMQGDNLIDPHCCRQPSCAAGCNHRATVRRWQTWRLTPLGGCWPAGAQTGRCGCGTPTGATAPTSSAATRAQLP